MGRYVVEGKLHKGSTIFIETEIPEGADHCGYYGYFLENVINKIDDGAFVTIVIDYKE